MVAGNEPVLVHNCNTIDPNEARFTQDSVGSHFKSGHSIDETAAALADGSLDRKVLDPIRLVNRNGNLFTLDNRRLVAFQKAGIEVPYRMATRAEIGKEWSKKFTTVTDGIGIRIRGVGWHGPGG